MATNTRVKDVAREVKVKNPNGEEAVSCLKIHPVTI